MSENGRINLGGPTVCPHKGCGKELARACALGSHMRVHRKKVKAKRAVVKPKKHAKVKRKKHLPPKEVNIPVVVNFCFNCGARQPNAHISGGNS